MDDIESESPDKLCNKPTLSKKRRWHQDQEKLTDWQRRMDGFHGFLVGDNKVDKKRRKSYHSVFRSFHPAEEKHELEDIDAVMEDIDWASSDDSLDCIPAQHKQREFVEINTQLTLSTQGSIRSWGSQSRTNSPATIKDEDGEPLIQDEDGEPPIKDEDPDSYNIADYKETASQQQESESEVGDISSGPSSTPTCIVKPEPAPEGLGIRGSEWAKTLKTPQKSNQGSPVQEAVPEDSAKKKQKFTKGGFAEKLSFLQSREKSALRFWQHQQSDEPIQDSSRCSDFFVKSLSKECSLYLAECQKCSQQQVTEGDHVLVVLSVAVVQRLTIQPRTQIRLFPPWQKIQIHVNGTRKDVLLCTNRCQVINSDGKVQSQGCYS